MTNDLPSPYYPPRARWYSRPSCWWLAWRRRLGLKHLPLLSGMAAQHLLLGLLLPGFAVWSSGHKRWGSAVAWGYGLSVLIFVLWLGYRVADLAFALMISLHVTSILHALGLVLHWRLRWRLLLSFVVLFIVAQVLYLPLRRWSEQHWVMPLRVKGHVVVVKALGSAPNLHRGDWVAYHYDGIASGSVVLSEGYGFNRVLAQSGDWVSFSATGFSVNGNSYPHQLNMPDKGQIQVPVDHWFIWPDFEIERAHGDVSPAQISEVVQRLALVSKEQLVGRALPRWFWRRQTLP